MRAPRLLLAVLLALATVPARADAPRERFTLGG